MKKVQSKGEVTARARVCSKTRRRNEGGGEKQGRCAVLLEEDSLAHRSADCLYLNCRVM